MVGHHRIQHTLVERGGRGTYLRAGHRRRTQQTIAIGGQQAFHVVEIHGGAGGVHVAASQCDSICADT